MNIGLFLRFAGFTLFAAIVLAGCGSTVEQGSSTESPGGASGKSGL